MELATARLRLNTLRLRDGDAWADDAIYAMLASEWQARRAPLPSGEGLG